MLDLLHLRHQLHAHPEVAGEEQKTANRVRSILNSLQPDTLLSPLGKQVWLRYIKAGNRAPQYCFDVNLTHCQLRKPTHYLTHQKLPEKDIFVVTMDI